MYPRLRYQAVLEREFIMKLFQSDGLTARMGRGKNRVVGVRRQVEVRLPCGLEVAGVQGVGVAHLHPSPGAPPAEERLRGEAESVRRRQGKRVQGGGGSGLRSVYRVGGVETSDIVEAGELLLRRDLPAVALLGKGGGGGGKGVGGGGGQYFLPSSWPGEEGRVAEVVEAVRRHYSSTPAHQVVVVGGAKLVLGPTVGRLAKFAAMPCLVVVRRAQLVLGVEVVVRLEEPGEVQARLEGRRRLLEEWFGGELREGWRFVGLVYTDTLGLHVCQDCQDFVMVGLEEVGRVLTRVDERVGREGRVSASPLVYRSLVSCLATLVAAACRGVEGGVAPWLCWTPPQLALVRGGAARRVALHGGAGVGKTAVLEGLAVELGAEVVLVRCGGEEVGGRVTTPGPLPSHHLLQALDVAREHPHHHLLLDSLPLPDPQDQAELATFTSVLQRLEGAVGGALWAVVAAHAPPDLPALLGAGAACTFLQEDALAPDTPAAPPDLEKTLQGLFPRPWLVHRLEGPGSILTD